MGRPGVTYNDVVMAAEQLASQGRNPTIESVRAAIGSGSTATIGPYLRAWRNKQDVSRQIAMKENLPAELISVVKGLWERVFIDAEAKFETARTEIQQSLTESQQKLSLLQIEYNRSQQQIAALTEEKHAFLNQNRLLEETINRHIETVRDQETEVNNQAARLGAQSVRIEELHQMHLQVQKNLEHYREASLTQRQHDQRLHEQQCQKLEHEIHLLRKELAQAQGSLVAVKERLAGEQKSSKNLVETVKEMKKKTESDDKMLSELREELSAHRQASEHWRQQHQLLETRATSDTKIVTELRIELAAAIQKLAITEESLREVTAQNRLLVKDKWILEQERQAS